MAQRMESQYRVRLEFTLSMRVESDKLADWQIDNFVAEELLPMLSPYSQQSGDRGHDG
jgi:hypothetical protein